MNQLNSIILEGNVTRKAEINQTPHGFKACKIPIAVNRFYKSIDGKRVQEVSFFDVEAFGKLADFSEKNVEIGRGIRIVGRLKQGRWKNAEGKTRSRVSVIAEHIEFRPRIKRETAPETPTEDEASLVSSIADIADEARMEEEEVMF